MRFRTVGAAAAAPQAVPAAPVAGAAPAVVPPVGAAAAAPQAVPAAVPVRALRPRVGAAARGGGSQ